MPTALGIREDIQYTRSTWPAQCIAYKPPQRYPTVIHGRISIEEGPWITRTNPPHAISIIRSSSSTLHHQF